MRRNFQKRILFRLNTYEQLAAGNVLSADSLEHLESRTFGGRDAGTEKATWFLGAANPHNAALLDR